jgi:chromate reductase, NAD(P)H dehydrogenase (quinone)
VVRLASGSSAMMQEQKVYIGNAASLFDDNGDIANDATREFLEKFLQVFSQWIERNIAK